jgi:hypothetical protein
MAGREGLAGTAVWPCFPAVLAGLPALALLQRTSTHSNIFSGYAACQDKFYRPPKGFLQCFAFVLQQAGFVLALSKLSSYQGETTATVGGMVQSRAFPYLKPCIPAILQQGSQNCITKTAKKGTLLRLAKGKASIRFNRDEQGGVLKCAESKPVMSYRVHYSSQTMFLSLAPCPQQNTVLLHATVGVTTLKYQNCNPCHLPSRQGKARHQAPRCAQLGD